MTEENRRIGKKAFGKYHLLKIKEGSTYQGLFFVDVPTLKEFDEIPESDVDKHIVNGCPFDVPGMCFPASAYVLVRHECQRVQEDHPFRRAKSDDAFDKGTCIFLVQYADTGDFGCRLKLKNDRDRVYEGR
jgi:hypothetical protein